MCQFLISKSLFAKEIILKVAYNLQKNFVLEISEDTDNYVCNVISKNNEVFFDKCSFFELLNEYQLRQNLGNEYGKLREAIYNKAFERFDY